MSNHKVKIVATVGPASDEKKILEKLILDGVNVFRINFSHATPEYAIQVIKRINALKTKLKKNVAIFIDLPGPKIRTGNLPKGELKIEQGKDYTFGPGCDIPVTSKIVRSVNLKHKILISDGKLEFKPIKREDNRIVMRAMNSSTLLNRQSVNATGLSYEKMYPTAKDREVIRFGLKHGVIAFALSFVSSKKDVQNARRLVGKKGILISKIERKEAVANFEEIASVSDIIMVARGDLGLNIDVARVPSIQKKLISSANRLSKPVITATQMLESMTRDIIPTRAEVDDVFTAISEGTDAVMLSEETAIGQHPRAAVRMLSHIISTSKPAKTQISYPVVDERDALMDATVSLIRKTKIKEVIVLTKSGRSAFRLARFHQDIRIFAVTDEKSVLCALQFGKSIIPIHTRKLGNYPEEAIKRIKSSWKLKKAILVSGLKTSNRAVESIRIIEP